MPFTTPSLLLQHSHLVTLYRASLVKLPRPVRPIPSSEHLRAEEGRACRVVDLTHRAVPQLLRLRLCRCHLSILCFQLRLKRKYTLLNMTSQVFPFKQKTHNTLPPAILTVITFVCHGKLQSLILILISSRN